MPMRKKTTEIDSVKPKRKYNRTAKSLLKTKDNKFELFFKALTQYFKNDRLSPGLTVAWLDDKHRWYASIHRYPNGTTGRVVLLRRMSEISASDATVQAINAFKEMISEQKNNYVDEFTTKPSFDESWENQIY